MEGIPQSLQGLYIFIVLLPGFVTLLVYRSLSYQRQDSGPITVARALTYSAVNYALFAMFGRPLAVWRVDTNGDVQSLVPVPWAVGGLLISGFVLGIVLAWLTQNDHTMRIARRLGATDRTAQASIWQDVFHQYCSTGNGDEAWCTVTLTDERRVMGWPTFYADEFSDGPVLQLSQARWLGDSDEADVDIPEPGLLLNGSQVKWIQFQAGREQEGEKKGAISVRCNFTVHHD